MGTRGPLSDACRSPLRTSGTRLCVAKQHQCYVTTTMNSRCAPLLRPGKVWRADFTRGSGPNFERPKNTRRRRNRNVQVTAPPTSDTTGKIKLRCIRNHHRVSRSVRVSPRGADLNFQIFLKNRGTLKLKITLPPTVVLDVAKKNEKRNLRYIYREGQQRGGSYN